MHVSATVAVAGSVALHVVLRSWTRRRKTLCPSTCALPASSSPFVHSTAAEKNLEPRSAASKDAAKENEPNMLGEASQMVRRSRMKCNGTLEALTFERSDDALHLAWSANPKRERRTGHTAQSLQNAFSAALTRRRKSQYDFRQNVDRKRGEHCVLRVRSAKLERGTPDESRLIERRSRVSAHVCTQA